MGYRKFAGIITGLTLAAIALAARGDAEPGHLSPLLGPAAGLAVALAVAVIGDERRVRARMARILARVG